MDFPLDLLTELHIDRVWTKVPTYERDAVELDYGRPDRSTTTDPGSLAITVNNRDGAYSPRNPMSPYFGKIGRNTRVRLSLPGEESYLELDGDPTAYASTPDTAALDLTMDLDLRWEGETDWYATAGQVLVGKWSSEPGQRSYCMRLERGLLFFHGGRDGVSGPFQGWVLPALPRRAAVRVTLTGGLTVRHYWAETMDGPWTQIGTDTDLASPLTTGLFMGTAPLLIAPSQYDSDPARPPVTGRVYRAEVRGASSTVVASPDFRAQAAGAPGFTDSAGRAWTLTGTAEIRDRHDLFIGEVSEWPQHWTPDGADAWVPLVASGILRRLGQGKKALQSSLRRRIPGYGPMAYWPMEEGEQATKAYSPVPGIDPLTFTVANWAADSSLPSSGPLPTIGSQSGNPSHMYGAVRNYSWASLPAWSVNWMYRMPQTPAARQTFMLIYSTGTVRDWYIQSGPDGSRIGGYDRDGNALVDQLIATGTDIFGDWVMARFAVEQVGSNVRYSIVWSDINGSAGFYQNTVAGVTGRPTGVSSPPGGYSENLQGMAIGHISVWDVFDTAAYDNAVSGWSGETAWARMRRLSDEEGLPLSAVLADQAPELVGPQTTETLLKLLQEAADADSGLLLEDRSRLGLVYRQRASMYSQTPRLILSYDKAPGLAAPLEPVDDDTAVRNDRTVKRAGGAEARAVLEEGPLSVQDPPDGIGRYDDSVTLSLHEDEQAEPIAYWRLWLGTQDAPRYPTAKILLHKAPGLIPAVLALTEGDLVRITDLPPWVGFGHADLIVDGVHHEMRLMQWTVTLTCQPAEPWQVGVVGDTDLGRVDTDGSVLAAAVDSDDTTISVTALDGQSWTTDPAAMPFDLRVGGEVMRVTACLPKVVDTFGRTTSNGWGTASSGLAWTSNGGSSADYSVTSGTGRISNATAGTRRIMSLPVALADVTTTITWAMPTVPSGDSGYVMLAARYSDPDNQYFARVQVTSGGAATLTLRKRVAGTETQLASLALGWSVTAGTRYRLRLSVAGTSLTAKAWRESDTEPATWQLTATDSSLTGPAAVAVWSLVGSGLSLPFVVTFDDVQTGGQLATVERSINGVTKSHTAGTDVRLATPAIVAL
ncbi:hypothetical protein B0E38_06458 [Streptomyces sp. 111WW2]|uniref:hypothetical protein n=1 Tax=Streptomyces sp. 111WW2 TaxID=1945515 RepID=UPI000D0C8872|nr:hypothetical protein [Streptomyces sp. 111WW2]PSK47981.1 hypothetical protein B0E38_06458 [Streptomyces sp. 111WW2]